MLWNRAIVTDNLLSFNHACILHWTNYSAELFDQNRMIAGTSLLSPAYQGVNNRFSQHFLSSWPSLLSLLLPPRVLLPLLVAAALALFLARHRLWQVVVEVEAAQLREPQLLTSIVGRR